MITSLRSKESPCPTDETAADGEEGVKGCEEQQNGGYGQERKLETQLEKIERTDDEHKYIS